MGLNSLLIVSLFRKGGWARHMLTQKMLYKTFMCEITFSCLNYLRWDGWDRTFSHSWCLVRGHFGARHQTVRGCTISFLGLLSNELLIWVIWGPQTSISISLYNTWCGFEFLEFVPEVIKDIHLFSIVRLEPGSDSRYRRPSLACHRRTPRLLHVSCSCLAGCVGPDSTFGAIEPIISYLCPPQRSHTVGQIFRAAPMVRF